MACHLISFAHDTCHAAVWTPVCTASESTMWVPNGQVYCWAIGSLINQRSELTFSLASVWLMLIGQPEGQPGFDIQPRPSPDAISHSTHPFHNIHGNIDVIIDRKNIQKKTRSTQNITRIANAVQRRSLLSPSQRFSHLSKQVFNYFVTLRSQHLELRNLLEDLGKILEH